MIVVRLNVCEETCGTVKFSPFTRVIDIEPAEYFWESVRRDKRRQNRSKAQRNKKRRGS
jgi:hypothetical protein